MLRDGLHRPNLLLRGATSAPIPAAEYMRMSDEAQRYSIENQRAAIRDYAGVAKYTSFTSLKGRPSRSIGTQRDPLQERRLSSRGTIIHKCEIFCKSFTRSVICRRRDSTTGANSGQWPHCAIPPLPRFSVPRRCCSLSSSKRVISRISNSSRSGSCSLAAR